MALATQKFTAERNSPLNTQNNSTNRTSRDSWKNKVFELVLFSMLGALMFCSKVIMEVLPNIHLLGMFTVAFTLTFRAKALIPIYINVILIGLYGGFNLWWVPYLYIWTVLWALAMLIPKRTPKWLLCVICPILCSCHGFLYGILYAPAQALLFKLNFEQTLVWIASGAVFDIIHGVGNFFAGLLIVPLHMLMKKLLKKSGFSF